MRLERLLQLRIARLLDHLRQRLGDLLFGVVDVLQRMDEQIVQRFDILRKKTHGAIPSGFERTASACAGSRRIVCDGIVSKHRVPTNVAGCASFQPRSSPRRARFRPCKRSNSALSSRFALVEFQRLDRLSPRFMILSVGDPDLRRRRPAPGGNVQRASPRSCRAASRPQAASAPRPGSPAPPRGCGHRARAPA